MPTEFTARHTIFRRLEPLLLLLLTALIGLVDYLTGPHLDFAVFYHVPTVLACIRYGAPGLLLAFFSSLLYLGNGIALERLEAPDVLLANLALRFSSFFLVGLISVMLHAAQRKTERARFMLQASLAEKESLLSEKQALLDCMPDAVLYVDLSGFLLERHGPVGTLLGLETCGPDIRLQGIELDPAVVSFFARLGEGQLLNERLTLSWPAARTLLAVAAPVRREGGDVEGEIVVFRDVTELVEAHAQLVRRVRTVAVQETRNRFARHLHDGLLQVLASLHMRLEIIAREIVARPATALELLAQTQDVTREAVHGVRQTVFELRPLPIEQMPLVRALEQHLQDVAGQSGLEMHLVLPSVVELDAEREVVVFMVVQEAVTNAVRHARATRLEVALTHADGQLCIAVRDDGCGFDAEAAERNSESLGLRDMRQRVALLGGTLRISSDGVRGTEVCFSVSLRQLEAAHG